MKTYAESIQKPGAGIFQGDCNIPFDGCVDYIMRSVRHRIYRQHEVYSSSGGVVVDKLSRDSYSIVPSKDEEISYFLFEAVQDYFFENFSASEVDSLVLAQSEFFVYEKGVGLKLHSDDHAKSPRGKILKVDAQRGITSILYLNSDFIGGEIFFPKQEILIKPRAGLFLIFPSNGNFPHEVRPILSGQRLSYQKIYGIVAGGTGSFLTES